MGTVSRMYRTVADIPAIVPVFPLSGALLLPSGVMPLNIFEPRYLTMIDHALRTDRLIGMIQPLPGDYGDGPPPLRQIGCLGRLSAFQETDDGRYLISLTGVCRYEILKETTDGTLFRSCKVSVDRFACDLGDNADDDAIDRTQLLEVFNAYLDANNLDADWDSIRRASDETLVNAFCMMCPYGAAEKQAFLEADCLRSRADLLIAITERDLAESGNPDGRSLQ